MRTMACSTLAGTEGTRSRIGGTGCDVWPCMIANVDPANGTVPVSIWYATMPSEY